MFFLLYCRILSSLLESGGWIPILGRRHKENQNQTVQKNQSIDVKKTKNIFENIKEKTKNVVMTKNIKNKENKKDYGKKSVKNTENQQSQNEDYKSSYKKQKVQKLEMNTNHQNFNLQDKNLSGKTSRIQEHRRLQRDFMEDDVQAHQEQRQVQEQKPDKLSEQDYWNKFWNNVPRKRLQ